MANLLFHKKPYIRFIFILASLVLVVGLVLAVLTFFRAKGVEAAWYSDTWGFRIKLTIDATKVGADQTDFPVYINLANMPANFHTHVNQTDARDIRVTKDDGTTELPREVVFYTAASDTGELHFKYTGTLSSTVDTDVYIYYGNASASDYAVTDTYGRNNVWDSNYKAVWHFTESTGAHADSTVNGNNSSAVTVTTQGTANAKLGGADDFDGINDIINNASPASLDNLGPLTYSAWIYPNTGGEGDLGRIIDKTGSVGNQFYVYNGNPYNALKFAVDYSGTGLSVVSATNSITMNTWQLVTVTWDDSATATNVHIYVNGTEVSSYDTRTNGTLNQPDDSAGNFLVGNRADTARTFDGQIDEVNVSGSVRSSTWISTQYNNQNSPSTFFTTGAAEEHKGRAILNFAFDEGYGTTAHDSSPNGYIGTLSGATTPAWVNEDQCMSGKCLYYNGSTAYTSVTTSVPNVQSVSFWVKPKTNGETLVDFDGGTHYITASSGTITASGFSSPTVYVNGQSGGLLVANAWQHVEVTTATAFTASNITIGKKTAFLNGYIDEFKVYDYARSAAQVKLDFNSRNSPAGVAARFGPDTGNTLSNGLVGYWKMDETSGNPVDSSGNGLTLTNNATTTFVGGKFGNGSEHVPASSQYFSTATTITGVKTISFWTNPDTTTNYLASLTSGAYITAAAGTISATGFANPQIYVNGTTSTTLTQDLWQLVTVTSDTAIDANQFYVGRQDVNYYDGTIDEVRTYNRALTPAEVASLYSWAPGPVAEWKMDENTGTSQTFDTSGNAYHLDLTSGAATDWKPGKFGSGHLFDGSADYATATPENGSFSSNIFSVSTWVYRNTDSGGIEKLVDNQDADNDGWSLLISATDFPTCSYNATDAAGTTAIAVSTWYHLECTSDGANILTYVNGILETTTAITGNISETTDARVAAQSYGTSEKFAGILDDIHVYNYARTPGKVIEDMNAGHPAPGSPVGSAVAYWKFDEGYGTTAYDSSINANNLTLSTASWTNSGKFGKAFNGLTNVRLSRTTDPDLEFSATEDFTLSLWYKSDSANNPGAIEYLVNDGAAAGAAGYAIYANTSGNLCFGIDDDTSWGPDVASCTTTDVYDNTWHHITAVRNVTLDTTKIYIDAIEKDSDTDSTTATLDSSPTFYIGDTNATDGTDEFLGDIDEVKIFRSALTSDAIKVLYNQSSGQSLGALSTDSSGIASNADTDSYCPPGQSTACTPPVGYWKLDENTGQSAFDVSGNGNTGTMGSSGSPDSADPAWTTGKHGSGVKTGIDDYVNVPDNDNYSVVTTGALTVETWINIDIESGGMEIISKDGGSNYEWHLARQNGGAIKAAVNGLNGTSYITNNTSTTVPLGQWAHIAFTIDTNIATPILMIYINGVLASTDTVQDGGVLGNGTLPVRFGINSSGTYPTYGSIDNVYIYNYARTPAQVAWDYNRGKPVGWWKLDENTGTAANDSMGNSTAGTLMNTPTWATGKFNQAVSFAGSDQHVLIGDDPDFDFTDDESMTLATWFKHTTASAQEIIMSKYAAAGYKIVMESDGDITCGLDYDSTWTPTDSATSTLATYDDGNWHHIACVKTGATSLALYIDGILITTDSSITATNTLTNADPVYFGIDADGTSNDFTGSLDDVRIYRYPLTVQQIKTVMGEGAVRFAPLTGTP